MTDRLEIECRTLARECETADPDRERELLYAVYEALRPKTGLSVEQGLRFRSLIEAGAVESAAVMLWPEGLGITVARQGPDHWGERPHWMASGWHGGNADPTNPNVQALAATEALSRVAAALKLWTL